MAKCNQLTTLPFKGLINVFKYCHWQNCCFVSGSIWTHEQVRGYWKINKTSQTIIQCDQYSHTVNTSRAEKSTPFRWLTDRLDYTRRQLTNFVVLINAADEDGKFGYS